MIKFFIWLYWTIYSIYEDVLFNFFVFGVWEDTGEIHAEAVRLCKLHTEKVSARLETRTFFQ